MCNSPSKATSTITGAVLFRILIPILLKRHLRVFQLKELPRSHHGWQIVWSKIIKYQYLKALDIIQSSCFGVPIMADDCMKWLILEVSLNFSCKSISTINLTKLRNKQRTINLSGAANLKIYTVWAMDSTSSHRFGRTGC